MSRAQPLASPDAWAAADHAHILARRQAPLFTRRVARQARQEQQARHQRPDARRRLGGPVELMGALRHQPQFEGLRLTHLVVEAQSSVDEFSGPRNHDLVARGELPSGECVVICVEAKAGESFGATVKQQTAAAARAKSVAQKAGKTSNAPARLEGLLARFVNHPTSEPR